MVLVDGLVVEPIKKALGKRVEWIGHAVSLLKGSGACTRERACVGPGIVGCRDAILTEPLESRFDG